MNLTGLLIVLLLAGFIITCAWIVWFRKDPTSANAAVDTVETAAGDAEAAASSAWGKFKAWRAKPKSGESKP